MPLICVVINQHLYASSVFSIKIQNQYLLLIRHMFHRECKALIIGFLFIKKPCSFKTFIYLFIYFHLNLLFLWFSHHKPTHYVCVIAFEHKFSKFFNIKTIVLKLKGTLAHNNNYIYTAYYKIQSYDKYNLEKC